MQIVISYSILINKGIMELDNEYTLILLLFCLVYVKNVFLL